MAEENKEEIFSDVNIDDFTAFIDNTESNNLDNQNNETNDDTSNNDAEVNNDLDDPNPLADPNEEEEEVEDKEDKENPSPDDTDDTSSVYTTFAKFLNGEGLLSLTEDQEIKSAEELVASYKATMEERLQKERESLDPRLQSLINNFERGVPLQDLLELDKDKLTYSTITEDSITEDVELQKQLVADYYGKTTQFSQEKITKLINSLEDMGDLEAEALASHSELNKLTSAREQQLIQEQEAANQEAIKQQQLALDNFNKMVAETSEIIPGVRLNDPMKESVKELMSTSVGQDNFGNPINAIGKARSEDPLKFDFNLAYIFKATKGFTDFSILTSSGKKSAMEELDKSLKQFDANKGFHKPVDNNRRSNNDTKELLDSMNFNGI